MAGLKALLRKLTQGEGSGFVHIHIQLRWVRTQHCMFYWCAQVLDPVTDRINSVAGSGSAGFADGRGTVSRLSEPGGLAAGPNGTVLVADTNNSLIRSATLCTSQPFPRPTPKPAPPGAPGLRVQPVIY